GAARRSETVIAFVEHKVRRDLTMGFGNASQHDVRFTAESGHVPCASSRLVWANSGYQVFCSNLKITLPPPTSDEIPWRHVWLATVLIDAGEPNRQRIRRPLVSRRMTLSRRLETLHRMRAALEPPGWWLDKN